MNARTILVPLDGSMFAECALSFAIGLAKRMNAAIELVHVAPHSRSGVHRRGGRVSAAVRKGVEERPSDYLRTTAERIEAVSTAQVLCTVLNGAVAKELVRHSRVNAPVLIVMSTHGRGPIGRARLGGVADWVVRHVSVPVLLARPDEGADCCDLTDGHEFANVVVALDGSSQAEDGCHWALKAGSAGTTYTLVRVAHGTVPVWAADTTGVPVCVDVHDYTKVGQTESVEYLRGVERTLMNESRNVASIVVERVPADVGILRTAERRAADLIVITTHGRGGLPRLLVGSVAERVVRGSHIPVLVAHREDPDTDIFAELREWEHVNTDCVGAE